MGLDTTHDCWHGAYSTFNTWRTHLCAVAGYGDLRERTGYKAGGLPWPGDDVLVELLDHSDCDGELRWQICSDLAKRLEELLPAMMRVTPDGYMGEKTRQFVDGLRLAHEVRENVEFH